MGNCDIFEIIVFEVDNLTLNDNMHLLWPTLAILTMTWSYNTYLKMVM